MGFITGIKKEGVDKQLRYNSHEPKLLLFLFLLRDLWQQKTNYSIDLKKILLLL